MKRKGTAVWKGTGKEGNGHLSTQSGTLQEVQYSYLSRFEEGTGTNPEELIAAAHAGCFTMKVSFSLGEAGITPDKLETVCTITLENGSITGSHLDLTADVKGMEDDKFQELVDDAAKNCIVSRALSINVTHTAKLNAS